MASLPKGAPEPERTPRAPDRPIQAETTAVLTPPPASNSAPTSDAPTIIDYTPAGNTSSSDAATIIDAGAPRAPIPISSQDQNTLPPGTVLGERYEIVALLGEGGMGAVYKAMDREVNRLVALKVIRPDLARNKAIIDRFKQELLLAREVTHRNVIRIYDLGEADRIKFITMEYVEGEDLRALLAGKKNLSPEEAVDIIQQVCRALDAAHSVGIIHRDLKPQNIMRDKTGRILVMDFGLARNVDGEGMTQTGALVGTMDYMSPEQALAQSLDQRSDIYTVGLIFYELLTGKMPFAADSALASLIKRTQERVTPISDKAIPSSISGIVAKCLEKDVAQRYQTTKQLLADLERWQGKRGGATLSFRAVAPWAQEPWPRIGLLLAAGVVVLAVVGGVMLRGRLTKASSIPNKAISVLVGDFTNNTGDPIFDDTLEPMFNIALEGATFINAYDRGTARQLAQKLPRPADKLDEQAARLIGVSQGIGAVVTGSLSRRGDGYKLSVEALDARTGTSVANAEVNAATKDALLLSIPKLAAPIRKALGDTTPESVQLAASGPFTAASLEVVHLYSTAMEQQFADKNEDALRSFSKAVELDPNFARAYSGMSATSAALGRQADGEKYIKLAMQHLDRMTERERYHSRAFYYFIVGDYPKCVEEYNSLVGQYPADRVGQANLAVCLVQVRNFPKALEAAGKAVEIVPRGAVQRENLSFLSSFLGDFQSGEREARVALDINPSSETGHLILGEAQLGKGEISQAAASYNTLEKQSPQGASLAAAALADLSAYEGHFTEAARILERAASADLKAKTADTAAEKLATLAYDQLLRRQRQAALASADEALAHSQSVQVKFLAGRVFAEAGERAKATKIATGLAAQLQPEPKAYAKIIEGKSALKQGDSREAIRAFTEANSLLDTWIGRFELGRAYLEAGLFVEADSEFDRCVKRRGEAIELFMDNVPTFAHFPLVYYYQGRVREALKSPAFADAYRSYLSIRGHSSEDPLVAEVHRRLGQ
jgi:eukaryotic-like serine/threonine-protein kinase